MAIKKNAEKKTEAPEVIIKPEQIKVTRAKEWQVKEGGKLTTSITFDMVVAGITIYGCSYSAGKQADGTEFAFVSFPQKKGKDDKYYNHVFFSVKEDTLAEIEKQIGELL